MRHVHGTHRRNTLLAGVPTALVGSLAASLVASPAHASTDAAATAPRVVTVPSVVTAPNASRPDATRVTTEASPEVYVVQPGDTVSGIAGRLGLRTDDVLAVNSLRWDSVIHPGQQLRLTGTTAADPAPAPESAAPAMGGSYTIVAGDTISAIAGRHGVSTDSVLAANGLTRESIIYPGQTLAIPLAAAPASAVETGAVDAADAGSPALVVPGLDAEQSANAQLIVRIGRELGVPDRGIAIALGTAMQESWIRNLDWGDRDSLGLFQQRPSTGWGTEDEVRDAERSIRAFYGGPSDPNGTTTRGLLDVAGWESLAFHEAAQAVQVSAYPERYAQWESSAYAWLAALG